MEVKEMVYLLNSAVMPKEGTYVIKKISKEYFIQILKYYSELGQVKSFIGYPQNAELIYKWSGVKVDINREQLTDIETGDKMLIMKLKYRVKDPSTKGNIVDENDFEFYICVYNEDTPQKIQILPF
jgi:hypothetical protein